MLLNYLKRREISKEIEQLDPVKDHERIVYLIACHCFPYDIERSLEFGFFRTFAVPSISRLLASTGEFKRNTKKRYDDTELIMYEIIENGYNSDRAQRAFKRMNAMHGAYSIDNDDFLYVLSTFVFIPIFWLDRFAWRKPTRKEKRAIFYFFKEVGKNMGIKNIPEDYREFKAFHLKYEKENFKYSKSNSEIAKYTRDLLISFFVPKQLAFIGRPITNCLMDEPLLNAMGFKHPNPILRAFVMILLQIRMWFMSLIGDKKKPVLGTTKKRSSYPKGYKIEDIGTFPNKVLAPVA